MATAKRKAIVIVLICLGITLTSVTLSAFYKNTATEITKGKIIDIKALPGIKMRGRVDEITYVYTVNGKDYACKQKIGVRFPKQAIGNRVKVEYKKEHPDQSEAIGFNMDFKDSNNGIKFHSSKKYGYHSIELINDVYYYTNYADSGYVLERIVGKYTTNKDTLIVTPFNHEIENKYRTVKYVLVQMPHKKRRWGFRNITNNRLYE